MEIKSSFIIIILWVKVTNKDPLSTPSTPTSKYSPETLITVQADDRVVIILQQQSPLTLPLGHERELLDRQRSHPLPVRSDAAQVTAVVVPVVLPVTRTDCVLGLVPAKTHLQKST